MSTLTPPTGQGPPRTAPGRTPPWFRGEAPVSCCSGMQLAVTHAGPGPAGLYGPGRASPSKPGVAPVPSVRRFEGARAPEPALLRAAGREGRWEVPGRVGWGRPGPAASQQGAGLRTAPASGPPDLPRRPSQRLAWGSSRPGWPRGQELTGHTPPILSPTPALP